MSAHQYQASLPFNPRLEMARARIDEHQREANGDRQARRLRAIAPVRERCIRAPRWAAVWIIISGALSSVVAWFHMVLCELWQALY